MSQDGPRSTRAETTRPPRTAPSPEPWGPDDPSEDVMSTTGQRGHGPRSVLLLSLGTALALLAAACGAGSEPSPTGSTGPPRSVPALELDVLDAVGGRLSYCDPDVYPVAHGDPVSNARERLPVIKADREVYEAILRHEHVASEASLTDDQLVAINEDYKQIQAIELTPDGSGYRFVVLVPSDDPEGNVSVPGTVSAAGQVELGDRGPGQPLQCPICLSRGTRIGTPFGAVPVEDVAPGMVVWSVDGHGRRIAVPVLRTGRTAAPLGHEVVRVTLADGRSLVASPGHPTLDGRTIGSLRAGDVLDGSPIVAIRLLPYRGVTFDLLPAGPTGAYVADGIVVGSTLRA